MKTVEELKEEMRVRDLFYGAVAMVSWGFVILFAACLYPFAMLCGYCHLKFYEDREEKP